MGDGELERDLVALVVPRSGRLVATGNRYEPYQLRDPDGVPVVAVTAYFRDLLAAGRAESTVRSYGMDLLRWFRFLWSDSGVGWDRATRVEARDFCRWMQIGGKHIQRHRPLRSLPCCSMGLWCACTRPARRDRSSGNGLMIGPLPASR